eukprot:scaffold2979_cov243-Pinguiococcus_pyrenoidosus.AAC.7
MRMDAASRRQLAFSSIAAVAWVSLPSKSFATRDLFNRGAIFGEDYWYKYGKEPPRVLKDAGLTSVEELSSEGLPFVRVQIRYDAYKKYADRIAAACQRYGTDLRTAVDAKDWDKVRELAGDKGDIALGLRPAGIFSTLVLSPDSVTPEAYLMRYYVNEVQFQLRDLQTAAGARDGGAAKEAYGLGRDALNSWIFFVNRVINSRVGEKFEEI